VKLIGEFFWTDRWIGSSAWLLPLEARGLYREMLTQAWRRGAQLPADDEQVKRACGVTDAEWDRCWPLIKHYWRVDGEWLVNDTQREVYAEAMRKQERRVERSMKANLVRWGK
jgi:uncharacterized protein YdaU (DUF1376 family)